MEFDSLMPTLAGRMLRSGKRYAPERFIFGVLSRRISEIIIQVLLGEAPVFPEFAADKGVDIAFRNVIPVF